MTSSTRFLRLVLRAVARFSTSRSICYVRHIATFYVASSVILELVTDAGTLRARDCARSFNVRGYIAAECNMEPFPDRMSCLIFNVVIDFDATIILRAALTFVLRALLVGSCISRSKK